MNTNEKQNISEGSVVYVSLPRVDQLSCAICEVDLIDVKDSSVNSNFHWQTIKCRLLIDTAPDIIASPILGTGFIFMIVKKDYCKSGQLLTVLKSLKLMFCGFQPVTREIYKVCLIYTIQCKIAPSWNKIGEYLVEGKDFYNSIAGTRAIKLNIIMGDKNPSFQLHAEKIKIPCAKLEDFNLPDSIISDFLADPKGCIYLSNPDMSHIHVLPSMKQGKVLSVSKEISPDCLFKDYEQLRSHWKNMYGYSLPETEDGILYYKIKFSIPRSDTFTYPNICIVKGPLINIPNGNNEATIQQFLSDMLKAVPVICGHHLKIIQNESLNIVNNEPPCTSTFVNVEISNDKQTTTCNRKQYDFNATLSLGCSDKDLNPLAPKTNNQMRANVNHMPIQSVEMGISKYFKKRKSHFQISNKEHQMKDAVNKNQNQRKSTIKEKLENARHSGSGSFVEESNQNIDVEAMAKNNKLGELTKATLSDWLRKHSVPHNAHQRKGDLINKVLSHIRNTRVLRTFRNM